MNKIILFGSLGSDPELKQAGSSQVLKFSLATSDSYKDKDGQWQESTDWHNVVVWGKRGESLSTRLFKGSKVLVTGKSKTRSWEDNDGNKKYTTEVITDNVEFGGSQQQQQRQEPAQNFGFAPDNNNDSMPF